MWPMWCMPNNALHHHALHARSLCMGMPIGVFHNGSKGHMSWHKCPSIPLCTPRRHSLIHPLSISRPPSFSNDKMMEARQVPWYFLMYIHFITHQAQHWNSRHDPTMDAFVATTPSISWQIMMKIMNYFPFTWPWGLYDNNLAFATELVW